MILDNEICIQYEIIKEIEIFFILNSIRKNTKSYDKKENKKRNTTGH